MRVLTVVLMLIATRVYVHYYPEMVVFGTHGGNIGVTLDGKTTQLCSVLRHPDVSYECHDAVPRPFYKEIAW